MWFDDDHLFGGRSVRVRHRKRKVAVLRVSARRRGGGGGGGGGKPGRGLRVSVFVLIPLVAAGVCAALWFGLQALGALLFSQNSTFTIKTLDIRGGPVITERLIREYTQLQEGMNLFGFNIRQVREDFLRRAPNVRGIQISRHLPDRLRIEVDERNALARIGRRGVLVADRYGVVFVQRNRTRPLPVIVGYTAGPLRPGYCVQGRALAALEVIDACEENPVLGLTVAAVDLDDKDAVIVTLADDKTVKLAWAKMGSLTPASRRQLMAKLGRVSRVLQSEQGRTLRRLDATLDGNKIYGR
jgi:cell division septal protein FtsQ